MRIYPVLLPSLDHSGQGLRLEKCDFTQHEVGWPTEKHELMGEVIKIKPSKARSVGPVGS